MNLHELRKFFGNPPAQTMSEARQALALLGWEDAYKAQSDSEIWTASSVSVEREAGFQSYYVSLAFRFEGPKDSPKLVRPVFKPDFLEMFKAHLGQLSTIEDFSEGLTEARFIYRFGTNIRLSVVKSEATRQFHVGRNGELL